MTNQKNKFLTLVFSCCPGAGQMYFGMYKMGVSLMGFFCGILAIAFWLNWEELLFILPVVWCFSFFHTHNLRRMTEEAFAAVEDRYFFADYVGLQEEWRFAARYRKAFAVLLLVAGISCLWRAVFRLMENIFGIPSVLWQLNYSVPQILMACFILFAAIRLLKEPTDKIETTEMKESEEAA